MLDLEKIGHKIASKRKEHNLTQNELAEALYVTHQAVSKWENGKSIPSIEIMFELTQLLNITIDYLLDNAEIDSDNYELLLQQYPREAVISKFLQQKTKEIDTIFYLLNSHERTRIIEQIISGTIDITVQELWHCLSKKERTYLLGVIFSDKFDYNLNLIYSQLSISERKTAQNHHRNGKYNYQLHIKL